MLSASKHDYDFVNDQTEEFTFPDKDGEQKPAFLVHGNRLAIAFWCLSDLYRWVQTHFKHLEQARTDKWWENIQDSQEILQYSHAALCLSADYYTAWNCRRQYLWQQSEIDQQTIEAELIRITRVLSKYPKSGECWAYRCV